MQLVINSGIRMSFIILYWIQKSIQQDFTLHCYISFPKNEQPIRLKVLYALLLVFGCKINYTYRISSVVIMENNKGKMVLGACLGECVHVLGILNFFRIIEKKGFQTQFMGPAIKPKTIVERIIKNKPHIVAISNRLTPKNALGDIEEFIRLINKHDLTDINYLLGGLPDLIETVKPKKFFVKYFKGGETVEEISQIVRKLAIFEEEYTQSNEHSLNNSKKPSNLIDRIKLKAPYPLMRAHFGLTDVEETVKGVKTLARAQVLDVISIAPDQTAQEWLQKPEVMKKLPKGSGGVPIRTREHLERLFDASNIMGGNHPLLRIYSGTQDLIANGKLFRETINNAWAAIPVFWYSQLDGRGPLTLEKAIQEHFDTIRWHAKKEVPVEINDPHQWGLRMAPDVIVVADAYLCACIAKKLGVKHYIEQMMFNTPPGNNFKMDLARVLAMWEIVDPLIDKGFKVIKQTRAGLAYFSPRENHAKGQLVASTMMQMAIQPDIVHVVSFCEATHSAKPEDIIESCQLLQKVVEGTISGVPDLTKDLSVIERKDNLIQDAQTLVEAIWSYGTHLGYEDPFLEPSFLSKVVKMGLFDAPQLKGIKTGNGTIRVRIMNGKTNAVDQNEKEISERQRIEKVFEKSRFPSENIAFNNHFDKTPHFGLIRGEVH